MRLNLGCGGDPRPGMLNVDQRGEGRQLALDARDLPWRDGSVSHIEAMHLVEHLGWVGCTYALCEWFRVLEPGGSLVIETPDLLASARELARAPFARRALLASWIYGLESPGMQHKFGFEHAVLRDLLVSCGFERIRRGRPRTHPDLPGLRLVATRSRSSAQLAHAHFKKLLRSRGIAPEEQAIGVELHRSIAGDLVRILARPAAEAHAHHALFARLAVHDPRIAQAALDACDGLVCRTARNRWRRLLRHPDLESLPALLGGALLARPLRPGQMTATYRAVRDAFRARLRALGAGGPGPAFRACAPGGPAVRPFSPAGLCLEAERQRARGLRCFVEGLIGEAEEHLELSARLNSNAPITFWNLARLALRARRAARAVDWIDHALRACPPSAAELRTALQQERARLAAGRPVEPIPVSPVGALPERRA